jgi:hypothetical protein
MHHHVPIEMTWRTSDAIVARQYIDSSPQEDDMVRPGQKQEQRAKIRLHAIVSGEIRRGSRTVYGGSPRDGVPGHDDRHSKPLAGDYL